jgi:hypothetical protein
MESLGEFGLPETFARKEIDRSSSPPSGAQRVIKC